MGTDKTAYGNGRGTRADNRDKKREERRRERNQRPVAEWEAVDAGLLIAAIISLSRAQGALRLGLSRDGGAYAFGIYGDGEPYTEYVGGTEDVNQYLKDLIEYFEATLS